MSHTNTRIYIDTTTDPPTGVTTADIAAVLGRSTLDLGQLCGDVRWDDAENDWVRVNATNPWAKYKSVRDPTITMIARTTISTYGLGPATGTGTALTTLPNTKTVQGILNFYSDNATLGPGPYNRANGWRYLAPRGKGKGEGGANEWFRIYDWLRVWFNPQTQRVELDTSVPGYDHEASNPFGQFVAVTPVSNNGGVLGISQRRTLPVGDIDDARIVITDFNDAFGSTSAWRLNYYGVLLIPLNYNDEWATGISAKLVMNNVDTIDKDMEYRGHENMVLQSYSLDSTNFPAGFYMAYPFITNIQHTASRLISCTYDNRNTPIGDGSMIFYPIPGAVPTKISVYAFQIEIEVHCDNAQAAPGGAYETGTYYTIKNNYQTQITIDNFYLKIRKAGKNYGDARTSGEVFYTKTHRYDDSYPSGVTDSTFASFLADLTIDSGETKRVPTGSLTTSITLPDSDTNNVFIGCYYGTSDQFGMDTPKMPINPNVNNNTDSELIPQG